MVVFTFIVVVVGAVPSMLVVGHGHSCIIDVVIAWLLVMAIFIKAAGGDSHSDCGCGGCPGYGGSHCCHCH